MGILGEAWLRIAVKMATTTGLTLTLLENGKAIGYQPVRAHPTPEQKTQALYSKLNNDKPVIDLHANIRLKRIVAFMRCWYG